MASPATNTLNSVDSLLSITFFVYPEGSVTPISDKELQVVTNIADGNIRRNQSVVFAVTSPPKLGRLVRRMPDNSTRNVSTFTQSMVGMCVSPRVSVCFFEED